MNKTLIALEKWILPMQVRSEERRLGARGERSERDEEEARRPLLSYYFTLI
jgi:hypothetical protein